MYDRNTRGRVSFHLLRTCSSRAAYSCTIMAWRCGNRNTSAIFGEKMKARKWPRCFDWRCGRGHTEGDPQHTPQTTSPWINRDLGVPVLHM